MGTPTSRKERSTVPYTGIPKQALDERGLVGAVPDDDPDHLPFAGTRIADPQNGFSAVSDAQIPGMGKASYGSPLAVPGDRNPGDAAVAQQ